MAEWLLRRFAKSITIKIVAWVRIPFFPTELFWKKKNIEIKIKKY
jgi:hypothetical protein